MSAAPIQTLPLLRANWALPARFHALMTLRSGGISEAQYGDRHGANGLNLGDHVGDDPQRVQANRERLAGLLPASPRWMRQVHGVSVYCADTHTPCHDPAATQDGAAGGSGGAAPALPPIADAAVTTRLDTVLAVLTADCLPVVLVDPRARVLGIAHAGWRGLAAGIIEATLRAMTVRGAQPARIQAWLGAAIGANAFEVQGDVRERFVGDDPGAHVFFRRSPHHPDRWLADLYGLAAGRLAACGAGPVVVCSGPRGRCCTHTDSDSFYSYRRDGQTGRMATLAWMSASD